jgi:hypothetical protein
MPPKVLDVSDDSVAASFCARLLAQCGLEVTKAVLLYRSPDDEFDPAGRRALFLDAEKVTVRANSSPWHPATTSLFKESLARAGCHSARSSSSMSSRIHFWSRSPRPLT